MSTFNLVFFEITESSEISWFSKRDDWVWRIVSVVSTKELYSLETVESVIPGLNSDVVLEDIIVESDVSTEIKCDFDDISFERVVVSTFNLVFFEITESSEISWFSKRDDWVWRIVSVVSTKELYSLENVSSDEPRLNSDVVFEDITVGSVASIEIICDFDDISIESVVVST